jgi:hypothetical protein
MTNIRLFTRVVGLPLSFALAMAVAVTKDEQGEPAVGAPRIHNELLKLGFELAESTVFKYMIRRRSPPSQIWRTFLRNHADAIAAIDLCVVPTLIFERLFAFLVLGHGWRQLMRPRPSMMRA